ncbi:MAG: SMC family ATPase [Ktedonobacterales bacterium]|nr:SMC family ATPase [Ktedonobacterales bacterium]
MRITKIELTNIKSYRHIALPLREGTTAIRGQNGAGKSTLVEAIGFALFDAMNYKQAQFVREGEKSGQVAVSFLSPLDDREYTAVRRCGNASDWFIYDPELDSRVVEQRADVLAFLRQHLRIEGEIKLSALFTDALGVTQGTFTADFLLTTSERKKKFDTLLQVEDYRKAAEKLNETRTYLREQLREQEHRIESLERETCQLPDWRAALEDHRARGRALAARLAEIQREATEIEARREALRRAEAEMARLVAAAQMATAALQAAEAHAREAAARHEEASRAVAICAATQPDYQAYLATGHALGEARIRERERNDLLARRGEVAQRLEGARRDHMYAQTRLSEALAAERRIVELEATVRQQGELEQRRQEAHLRTEQLTAAEERMAQAQREREGVARERDEARRTLATLDALRPEAERLAACRERLEALQAAHAARAQQEKRLSANRAERNQAHANREKAAALEAKQREDVRKIHALQTSAEELPTYEASYHTTDDEVRQLEASLAHNRLARQQSGQGSCPFLREPCLNIRQRGENSLLSYFDRLIERDEDALVPVRARREAASSVLEQIRRMHTYYLRLAEYEERHQQSQEALAQLDAQLARLADEETELTQALAHAPDARALAAARDATRRAEDADRKLATYETIQLSHERLCDRHATLEAEQAALQAHRDGLATAPKVLVATQAALDALGDPRAESKARAETARERPRLEAALHATEAQTHQLAAALAQCDGALQPYSGLDDALRALETESARTRDGHTRYLQHERIAARLPEDEATQMESRQKRQQALAAHEAALAACEGARARFDAAELARVSARADALGAERGQKTAEQQHTQETAARLEADIARVERLEREDLTAAREECQTLDDLATMLQHFRESIKEAGPYIVRALLRHISVEANRIFGEIMGDRSAQLSWEEDYEVVLRRDGRERGFALLSGGERMSAALAVRLALLRSLTRLDIAFFDEPTQNMDGQRRGNLAEQIQRIRGFEQLLVISHDDTFEQGLDSVISLEKRNGETILADIEAMVTA